MSAILPQWDVAQCCAWLRSIGLGQHAAAFEAQDVDGALLLNLDDEMLVELGIDSRLQRTKLLLRRDAAAVGTERGAQRERRCLNGFVSFWMRRGSPPPTRRRRRQLHRHTPTHPWA